MTDQLKSKPVTLSAVVGDFLKEETTNASRVMIAAPVGTKIGQFVDYPPYKTKLLALSNESDGKVMVQPLNCVMELEAVAPEDLAAAGDLNAIVTAGFAHGIVYKNHPPKTTDSSVATSTLPNPS